MLALDRALLGPCTPRHGVHRAANANSGRSASSAKHFGVLRGFVSAYSQNDVAGTTQRLGGTSHLAPVRAPAVARGMAWILLFSKILATEGNGLRWFYFNAERLSTSTPGGI